MSCAAGSRLPHHPDPLAHPDHRAGRLFDHAPGRRRRAPRSRPPPCRSRSRRSARPGCNLAPSGFAQRTILPSLTVRSPNGMVIGSPSTGRGASVARGLRGRCRLRRSRSRGAGGRIGRAASAPALRQWSGTGALPLDHLADRGGNARRIDEHRALERRRERDA